MFQLLPLFLAYIMFALGLQIHLRDFKEVLVKPKALIIGLSLQLLLVPAIAYLLVSIISPPSEIGFGIMLLSICAGGITTNMWSFYAGGKVALSIALTAIASIAAIVTVPFWVQTFYPIFLGKLPGNFSIASLSLRVLLITTVPVLLGISVRQYAPTFVKKWHKLLQQVANFLFALMVVLATIQSWDLMMDQISQIGALVLIMALSLLIISQIVARVFKLDFAEQKTLGIEVSMQNGAMGITLGSILSQSDKLSAFAMPSAVYGVLMNFIVLPFVLYHFYKSRQEISEYRGIK